MKNLDLDSDTYTRTGLRTNSYTT